MSSPLCERVYVGLGANLDDPVRQLDEALRCLAAAAGITLLERSDFYRTAPWGQTDQPDFVNAVAAFDCALSPDALMALMLRIEREGGRERGGERWGPRRVDLDVIVFADRVLSTATLQLPHPRHDARSFVLVPLIEVAERLGDARVEIWKRALSKLTSADVVRLRVDCRTTESLL